MSCYLDLIWLLFMKQHWPEGTTLGKVLLYQKKKPLFTAFNSPLCCCGRAAGSPCHLLWKHLECVWHWPHMSIAPSAQHASAQLACGAPTQDRESEWAKPEVPHVNGNKYMEGLRFLKWPEFMSEWLIPHIWTLQPLRSSIFLQAGQLVPIFVPQPHRGPGACVCVSWLISAAIPSLPLTVWLLLAHFFSLYF